jgi:hypothetical protein
MPEEIEVPTEQLHETLAEKAEHAEGGPWIGKAALSSALIAVAAAVASLLASHHANEAMLEQMQATDKWAYYQAKGIKSAVLDSKVQLLEALGKPTATDEKAHVAKYEEEQHEIEDEGHELESSSRAHRERHSTLARAVTIFQIAIALAAISVLVRRRTLWYGSMALGLGAAFFLVQGIR